MLISTIFSSSNILYVAVVLGLRAQMFILYFNTFFCNFHAACSAFLDQWLQPFFMAVRILLIPVSEIIPIHSCLMSGKVFKLYINYFKLLFLTTLITADLFVLKTLCTRHNNLLVFILNDHNMMDIK